MFSFSAPFSTKANLSFTSGEARCCCVFGNIPIPAEAP
jgi:hypothetical protein